MKSVSSKKDEKPPGGEKPRTVEVLVAKRDLNAYERIVDHEQFFTRAIYRAGEEPDGAVSFFHEVKDMVMIRDLKKGHPLRRTDFVRAIKDCSMPESHQGYNLELPLRDLPRHHNRVWGERVDIIVIIGAKRIELVKDALVVVSSCHRPSERELRGETASIVIARRRADVLKVNAALEMGRVQVLLPERMEPVEPLKSK
jgi:hypothetical protein